MRIQRKVLASRTFPANFIYSITYGTYSKQQAMPSDWVFLASPGTGPLALGIWQLLIVLPSPFQVPISQPGTDPVPRLLQLFPMASPWASTFTESCWGNCSSKVQKSIWAIVFFVVDLLDF